MYFVSVETVESFDRASSIISREQAQDLAAPIQVDMSNFLNIATSCTAISMNIFQTYSMSTFTKLCLGLILFANDSIVLSLNEFSQRI